MYVISLNAGQLCSGSIVAFLLRVTYILSSSLHI